MIFGERFELTLKLELLGHLHIGSGAERTKRRDAGEGDDETTDVALVVRDADDRPVIPGTSLKGALRAHAPADIADRILGTVGALRERSEGAGNDGSGQWESTGRIARLWLDGLTLVDAVTPTSVEGLTVADGQVAGAFERTGVALDRRTGTAEDKKLYTQEWVPAGSVFEGRATLFLDDADEDELRGQLAQLLTPLVGEDGLPLGADRRHGMGRVRLVDLVVVRRRINPATLDLDRIDEPTIGPAVRKAAQPVGAATTPAMALTLTASGPFISIREKAKAEGADRETTQPLEHAGRPWLWPSSLLGVLRTRAAWLAELARLRGDDSFAPARAVEDAMDDPNRVIRKVDEVATLSSVERLFGVTGWRGLVEVVSLAPRDGAECRDLTSVAIDRFTGGALDQKLFTTTVFLGAVFDVGLALRPRGGWGEGADAELFEQLLDDVDTNGLELGHGAAKGFGWFDAEVRR